MHRPPSFHLLCCSASVVGTNHGQVRPPLAAWFFPPKNLPPLLGIPKLESTDKRLNTHTLQQQEE